jgi:hypothetical protein
MAAPPYSSISPKAALPSRPKRTPVSAVLGFAALGIIGTALASCGLSAPTASPPKAVTSSESAKPTAPFETADGFAWLTAACGSPSVMDASPNSWLPGASNVALCVTPLDRPPVLVGVYDDPSLSATDITKIRGQRGYATRKDDAGRTWIFVLEGVDPAPLKPLERYGFVIS